eukprot:365148_1
MLSANQTQTENFKRRGGSPDTVQFDSLGDIIPLDPQVHSGKLENGFSYFIRQNSMPKQRAELQLVIKVGSTSESKMERGVAHLIEHLSFRATRASPEPFALVRELEASGIKFGAHQNAHTSFDETVYELHIPTGEGAPAFSKCLQVLHQLALEVRLSDSDIDEEKSIVEEEWRASRGARQRFSDKYLELMCKGTLYAERLPIGLISVIRNISPNEVRAFYSAYYHPENMCLICVGDFLSQMLSVSDVIGEIRTIFSARGDLPADVPKLLPRRNIVVPLRDHPCAGMFTDPEISYTSLGLEVLSPVPKQLKTIRDFRNLLIEELFQAILSLRLRKRALQPNPPFLSGVCESYSEIGNLHSIQLSVQCTELGAKTAMEATLAEVEDIRLRGISHAEISKAIQDMKAQTQSSWVERGQLDSGVLSDELKNLFLKEIAAPGIEWEAGIEPTLLNGIKMDEVQAVVNELHWGNGTIIYLIRPSIGMKYLFRSMLSSLPSPWWNVEHHHLSENDLLTILKSRKANDPKSGTLLCNSDNNEDEEVDSLTPTCFSDLIPNDLVSGDILNRVEHPGIGSIEIELSNGMHVLYKETSFQDDEVVFCGFAYGGLSEYISYKDSSYSLLTTEARMANAIAEELGILGIIPAQINLTTLSKGMLHYHYRFCLIFLHLYETLSLYNSFLFNDMATT